MSLEYIKKDGSENGSTVADKINAIMDKFGTSVDMTGDLDANGFAIFGQTLKKQTGLSLSVANASLLVADLTGDSTIAFTDIPTRTCEWLVMLDANGYTITWDGYVEWDGDGSEPAWGSGEDTVYFCRVSGSATIKGTKIRGGA